MEWKSKTQAQGRLSHLGADIIMFVPPLATPPHYCVTVGETIRIGKAEAERTFFANDLADYLAPDGVVWDEYDLVTKIEIHDDGIQTASLSVIYFRRGLDTAKVLRTMDELWELADSHLAE